MGEDGIVTRDTIQRSLTDIDYVFDRGRVLVAGGGIVEQAVDDALQAGAK